MMDELKTQKRLIVMAGIVIVSALIGIGSAVFLGSENEIEEGMEAVVKQETGVDIDFTPSTKERNN